MGITDKPPRIEPDEIIAHNRFKPLPERQAAHKRLMEKALNPVPAADFDPTTYDPMQDDPQWPVFKRSRVEPPARLPNLGMMPKQLLEGQNIGLLESKQDLYLLIAWLSHRVADLEDALTAANIHIPKPKK